MSRDNDTVAVHRDVLRQMRHHLEATEQGRMMLPTLDNLMDRMVCAECGGLNIECLNWVDPNTDELVGGNEDDNNPDHTWCRDCEEHTGLAFENEYCKQKEG